MLQTIRDRAQGWIAGAIVLLIIIPFALWGIQDYLGGGADPEVAHVGGYLGGSFGGKTISLNSFQQVYEEQRQRLRQLLGENSDLLDAEKLKQDVLDKMVESELFQQSAHDLNLRIGDAQLAEHIQTMSEFQDQGQFSRELFTRQVRDPAAFEAFLRQSLVSEQLNRVFPDTALVTPYDLAQAIRLKQQQREIGYLVLAWKNFEKDVVIAAEDVKRYYEKHRDKFVNPEQVSVEYLELSAADLQTAIPLPDEQVLRSLYAEQQAQFETEEQRRASHILIKINDKTDEATAKAKAQSLLKRVQSGESFAKLAKEYSQDPGSAERGGDLGLFGRGTMVQPFEDSVFALEEGKLSGLVQSPSGFHIIKLTEIQSARLQSFEAVREQLGGEYRKREAEKQYFDYAERLRDLAYEHPDNLNTAAGELGLVVKTAGLFSRQGGAGIAAAAHVVSAAFSDVVLERGENSDPIELGDNHVVVLRVKERKPSSQRSLDEERQAITSQLTREAAQIRAQQAGEALQARLAGGEAPEALAKANQTEWISMGWVGREELTLEHPDVLRAAFMLARPDATTRPSATTTELPSGDYAVVALFAVREGSAEHADSAVRTGLERELRRDRAAAESQAYLKALKTDTTIVIQRDKLTSE
jgi:peptidyl-prolyl cis-trans isomerase D